MASVDVTNNDADVTVSLQTFTRNGMGTFDRDLVTIELEPGAGTAIVVSDSTLLVVKENGGADPAIPLSTAHRDGETTETEATPE